MRLDSPESHRLKWPSGLDFAKFRQCHAMFQVRYCNPFRVFREGHRQIDIAWITCVTQDTISKILMGVRHTLGRPIPVKDGACQSVSVKSQGLYSLSGKTSYRQISWSLEATRLMLQWSYRSEIWQALQQQRCRGTCQISERLEKFKSESRGFETSRDLAVRRLTA